MDNHKLLKKYRKKLSIYFSIFVLFSILLVVLFFNISKYINSNNKEKNILITKTSQLKNILRNSSEYSKLNEITFKKILKKIIKNTLIITNWKIIINEIGDNVDINVLNINEYKKINSYIYYQTNYTINNINYTIIVRSKISYSIESLLNDYLYFLFFSLPFIIIFYFIWYFFVWKNLNPIKETIINLEDFTWNINHEFKTPLSEIISSLELSLKTWEYKNPIKQSIKSAKWLNNILDSLLWIISITDFSYKKQIIEIVNYCKQIIKENKNNIKTKKINIILKSEKKIIYKKINKEHFYIVFSNLLSNAIKYSKKNWNINIYISRKIYFIEDLWIWISKNNLKNIFSKYFRENYSNNKWAWIGLSLSKKICEINNWKIEIKSIKKQWTKVSIYFL